VFDFVYICQSKIETGMKKTIQIVKNIIRLFLTKALFGRYLKGLGPGRIAIDCGANVGDITVQLAGTGAEVYAFEPNPFAFERLKDRTRGYPNVTCINKGVWDKNTSAELYFHKEAGKNGEFWSFASSIFSSKGNVDPNHSVTVGLIDLAEFILKLERPVDLLKIDIEGAECEVLEEFLNKDLQNKVKLTLVETHDSKIQGLKEKTDRVRKLIREKKAYNVNLSWL
jgi:FkbM family methyltransferase